MATSRIRKHKPVVPCSSLVSVTGVLANEAAEKVQPEKLVEPVESQKPVEPVASIEPLKAMVEPTKPTPEPQKIDVVAVVKQVSKTGRKEK